MGKFTIFGPYELRARPSIGGMAEVFHAIDTRAGTPCAIKRLLPSVAEDEEVVTMFEDEARIAATLDHPNVARVLEFGAIDGQYFIAYELVDGVDLREAFDASSMASEPLPLDFLLRVFTGIGEALAHAHDREVVHRDVTPQNIVLSFDGDVKLIDFGIAKAKGKLSRTGAGRIKGKLGYMSPEQVRSASTVDARTDVFSLGICMWELLTLKRLFSSPNEILVLDMVKNQVPEPPSAHRPEVGPDLDRIVLKALAKNTDERYRSARELTKDLDAFVAKTKPLATRADLARTLRRTFGDRSTGSIMEFQETRMSDDNKSGSDLDIFEGLGKKSAGRVSAVPPPPPGSASNIPSGNGNGAPSGNLQARPEMKRTLMGIPGPAQPPSQNGIPAPPPTTPSSPPVPAASAAPPPPPVSAGRVSVPPPLPSQSSGSGSMRAVSAPPTSPSKPPPPPGRNSLPNLAGPPASQAPSASTMPSTTTLASAGNIAPPTQKGGSGPPPPPPAASTRPAPPPVSTSAAPVAAATLPANASTQESRGKLDMDWDDEDEATHVFDKETRDAQEAAAAAPSAPAQGPESRRPEHASMDDILSSRPSAAPAAGMPPPAVTLTGQFGSLGQPRESNGGVPSNQFRSGAPPSQSLRSAPPPPPGAPPSLRGPNPSTTTAPIPPPPPPGQTTTAPMHMPVRPNSQPPPSMAPSHQGMQQGMQQGQMPQMQGPHSVPPQQQHPSQGHQQVAQSYAQERPQPQLPPVSRAMEQTAVVPRQQPGSKAGLIIALIVGVFAAMAIAGFFLMPRTGTLVVNVADAKGGAVSKIEIIVDDKKACDSAPCIVRDVQSGVHQVKVVAQGFEPPAPRAVTIEARKDSSIDFALSPSAAARSGGTGVKVSGTQNGVKLLVDGKEYGLLPQEIHDLAPGEHKVKIAGSERYAPLEKTIEVKQDELTDLGNVSLKVLKGKATIQLGTPGAKVYLVNGTNRKEVPQFPIAIDFDPNEKWQLEGKMLGMEDYSSPISFDDGQAEKTIVVTLSPKGTMPAMNVTNAGVPAVRPPQTFVAPTPKEPVVAADPPTPKAPKEPAAAAGGEAFLNINSRPASTVLLDGKPLGPTPRVKVSVSAGTHTVLFVNAEESLKKSVSVTVAAGETKAVSAKLRD